MSFEELLAVIEERIGIEISGARLLRLERLYKEEGYMWEGLRKHDLKEEPWQKVIDAVTVQETYFYRDQDLYECLKREIIPQIAKRIEHGKVKVWSAGCATGEEVYTLAILFAESLSSMGYSLPSLPNKLLIMGTDISLRALQTAKEGFYRDIPFGSFRNAPDFLMKYFHKRDKGYKVEDRIKAFVQFEFHNLLDKEPPLKDADLVLCRNVLIYFTERAKERAYHTLGLALRKGGFLFLGALDNPNMELEKRSCGRVPYFCKP